MSEYLNNLKLMIIGQTKYPKQIESEFAYDLEYENDNEYTKIDSKNLQENIVEIKKAYEKIQIEMISKEQLVRKRLDSDTIEKIKSNCEEYVNDDVKIIKDFALIMESFNHIKEKLVNFEFGIKEFESEIKIKTLNQDENNAELDNRINHIDTKLDNTIQLMEQIKINSNGLMEKIVKLENIISEHSTQRCEILSKLNKINFDKSNQTKSNYHIFFNNYLNLNNFFSKFNNDILIVSMLGCGVLGTFLSIKYFVIK